MYVRQHVCYIGGRHAFTASLTFVTSAAVMCIHCGSKGQALKLMPLTAERKPSS
jgi:hypothetical protein